MPTVEERMCNVLRALEDGTYDDDDPLAVAECIDRDYFVYATDSKFMGHDSPRQWSGRMTPAGRRFLGECLGQSRSRIQQR